MQILTHLGNSASEGDISVFLVHVDCFSSGQVSENNSVVLNDSSVLLVNLLNRDDLSLHLSDLMLSLHVVPELGLSKNWVFSEHSHSEEWRVRVLLRRKSSADNKELSHLKHKIKSCNKKAVNDPYLGLHGLNSNTFDHFSFIYNEIINPAFPY